MELTQSQYERIADCLPRQRGNVSLSNLAVLNAILYVAEHGCKWRGLPKRFGSWHTIYTRMNRWAKAGVLDRVFVALQQEQIIRVVATGVQVLFAFLLIVPFSAGFKGVSPGERYFYFAILLSTAAASVLLIAPTALHRLIFRKGDKPYLSRDGSSL